MSAYHFRPLSRADLAIVAGWLQTPEVARWWGEPAEQLALIAGDIEEPMMRQWIVEHDGLPFAYLQAYPARAWRQSHLAGLPDGSEVIDAFIGVPDMVGRGHGSAFLRAFAERLIAEGAPVVAIDPDIGNYRARRAYARAGFVADKAGDAGDQGVVVMLFRPKTKSG